ncbi:septal ring lytic transglycosylase RlpA family protein [Myroides odoratimimus]|uniref:septal ring lytic transglycosylase RlpA family protein n=1 Tax=Myroides odoratimimus TaxID=76832 RepID=UPI0031012A01
MKSNYSIKYYFIVIILTLFLGSCSSVKNRQYTSKGNYKSNVTASYYHKKFNGKRTASGEKFHNSGMTAAHKSLPFNTKVKVTNVSNKKSVKVRINDRGPFVKGREIDLSKKAFMKLADHKGEGLLQVDIKIIK